MLNLIIFGAPGSGKGTQSTLIKDKYNLLHLSTGDLLRAEIAEKTELGILADSYISKGQLVPDKMIISILDKALHEKEKNGSYSGFILDGFPRTIAQAEALEEILEKRGKEITLLIDLNVDETELVTRILKRGETSGRADDNPETIKSRLAVYHEKTHPLIDFYKNKGKHRAVHGMGTLEEIFKRICEVIKN